MHFRGFAETGFARLALLSVIAAVAGGVTAFGGCGSDSSGPTGKYPLEGTATLEDQTNNSGIRITVSNSEGSVASVSTAEDGSFTLPSLGDGDYTLKAKRRFFSTLIAPLQVRNGLLVDPLDNIEMPLTFSVAIESDSLRYTHESDSVFIWMVLKNEDVEELNLDDEFARPYDFTIYDPAEGEEIVWQWSDNRPWINEEKERFEMTLAAMASDTLRPHKAWDKTNRLSYPVSTGDYELEGEIIFVEAQGRIWEFVTPRRVILLAP